MSFSLTGLLKHFIIGAQGIRHWSYQRAARSLCPINNLISLTQCPARQGVSRKHCGHGTREGICDVPRNKLKASIGQHAKSYLTVFCRDTAILFYIREGLFAGLQNAGNGTPNGDAREENVSFPMSSGFNGIILSGLDGILKGFIMEHANATIARTGATPVSKAVVATIGKDAMLSASILVAEVIGMAQQDAGRWNGFSQRVRALTTDGRVAFLQVMAEQTKAMKANNVSVMAVLGKDGEPLPTKDEKRLAGAIVGTATNYVSQLTRIADAWNRGATDAGLVEYVKVRNRVPAHASIHAGDLSLALTYEYVKEKYPTGRGPKVKSFAEKLAAFLEKNAPDETDSDGFVLKDKVVALLSTK